MSAQFGVASQLLPYSLEQEMPSHILIVNGTIVTGNPLEGTFRVHGLDVQAMAALYGITPDESAISPGIPCPAGHMHGLTDHGLTTFGKELGAGNERLVISLDETELAALLMFLSVVGPGRRLELVDDTDWLNLHRGEMLLAMDQSKLLKGLLRPLTAPRSDLSHALFDNPVTHLDPATVSEAGLAFMPGYDPLLDPRTGHGPRRPRHTVDADNKYAVVFGKIANMRR